MNFMQLRRANVDRNAEWDPEGKLNASFRGLELAGEVGELCNLVKKLERERMGIPGSRATFLQLCEELADVQICLDLLAMHYSIDLGLATKVKFNQTSDKMQLKTRLP